jgi:TetR/AcrR family transcriptional repressor of mexCD-oprJ operon
MVERTRRRADAERNIAAILDAAVDRFAASPDASMSDIARAAGVGRMTLYGHFASRDELLRAATNHAAEQIHAAFEELDLDRTPTGEALEALLRASWHMIERHRAFLAAAHHQPDAHHQLGAHQPGAHQPGEHQPGDHHQPGAHQPGAHHQPGGHHEHVFQRLDELIARGQADGTFRGDQPASWLAAACIGLVHAAVTQVESGRMAPGAAVDALLATVRAAYRPA